MPNRISPVSLITFQRNVLKTLKRGVLGARVTIAFFHKTVLCFQITVPVTKSFVEYIKHQPMIFEVFGHYQPPALHRVAIHDASNQQVSWVRDFPATAVASLVVVPVLPRNHSIFQIV